MGMQRVVSGLLFFVAGVLLALGVITALQVRSPIWQRALLIAAVVAVAMGIGWVARKLR
ncbi:MAG: hypothetical protein MUP76_05855 [Acidimicrobiia bacterium]|nr:hypothetical protein [Acidimicrobiia bacterium]